MTTRPGDEQIRAGDVREGDELHLTVMGGDEYVPVEFKKSEHGMTTLKWTSWGGPIEDQIDDEMQVWIRKRPYVKDGKDWP